MHAVDVHNLRFGYGDQLVVNVDRFTLEQGKSVAVIGPSGCGKTSFMHLLAGLLTPDAGRIELLGEDLTALQGAALDRFRGRTIGLVLQRFHLLRALSVRQNIALASKLAGTGSKPAGLDELLRRLNLMEVVNHKPAMLSFGQAQRTAIARALVHRPRIVLADEPTSGLDDENAASAIDLLKRAVADSGAALLVVTHDQRIRGSLDADFDFRAPA